MKVFFRYLLDKRFAIITYVGIVGLFAMTFFSMRFLLLFIQMQSFFQDC
ncbi:hypothetical protein [Candidatus Enterococcus lemimoniae]|uniref:Uncharacterized protein n=1 Tax=Candidatus Enterococcus lemimoniae TaxID=1834167 RepID=A0ABZ2T6B9_9ENTE|nr:hypothetical protein [Enterococcus sp. 12C11_DIV0727]OTO67837.1 hypothetical protein A5866_000032 [Enterococcus sp. 12C11_DIV0727]